MQLTMSTSVTTPETDRIELMFDLLYKRVRKIGGSFQHTGRVVTVFHTTNKEVRIVVEFDPPVQGMLHIYRPDQVEKI